MKVRFLTFLPILMSVIISTSAIANDGPFCGVYGGINIGMSQSEVKDMHSASFFIPDAFNIDFTLGAKSSDISPTLGVTLGFSTILREMFFVGIEGRANFTDFKTKIDNRTEEFNSGLLLNIDSSVESKRDYSILAKLGAVIDCKYLIYGLIGPDRANFDISTTINHKQTLGDDFVASGSLETNKSGYKTGLLLGIGTEYLITKCSSIGIEYNYINYKKLNFPDTTSGLMSINNVPAAGSSIADNKTFKVQINRVALRYNYYFM